MRKKAIIAVLILLAFGAGYMGLVLLSDGGDYPIEVTGNLTTNDVKAIKLVVRKHLRMGIIPDLSWKSLQCLPNAIKTYSKSKILRIESITNERSEALVSVLLGTKDPAGHPTFDGLNKWLRHTTNGWEWLGEISLVPD